MGSNPIRGIITREENMMEQRYISMSKKMSLALRHDPNKFGISLDQSGWTDLQTFLSKMHISQEDLDYIQYHSDKQRYEIDFDNGRIRAVYGHSIPNKIIMTSSIPPEILFHGTPPKCIDLIMSGGFKPMGRQYVHYSSEFDTAFKVGERRSMTPAILAVKALAAYNDGHEFYHGNEDIWMSNSLPAKYIDRIFFPNRGWQK